MHKNALMHNCSNYLSSMIKIMLFLYLNIFNYLVYFSKDMILTSIARRNLYKRFALFKKLKMCSVCLCRDKRFKLLKFLYSLPSGSFFMLFCRLLLLFKINIFEKFLQEYNQSVKQFGFRSGPTFCRV